MEGFSYKSAGMCPGLGERWLHKEILNLATGCIYAQTSMLKLCLGLLVHTLFCVKMANKTKHFDISGQ